MLQPEDVAATVLFVASLPQRACIEDVLILPTHLRDPMGSGRMRPKPREGQNRPGRRC
jgi:hypothetical protein